MTLVTNSTSACPLGQESEVALWVRCSHERKIHLSFSSFGCDGVQYFSASDQLMPRWLSCVQYLLSLCCHSPVNGETSYIERRSVHLYSLAPQTDSDFSLPASRFSPILGNTLRSQISHCCEQTLRPEMLWKESCGLQSLSPCPSSPLLQCWSPASPSCTAGWLPPWLAPSLATTRPSSSNTKGTQSPRSCSSPPPSSPSCSSSSLLRLPTCHLVSLGQEAQLWRPQELARSSSGETFL